MDLRTMQGYSNRLQPGEPFPLLEVMVPPLLLLLLLPCSISSHLLRVWPRQRWSAKPVGAAGRGMAPVCCYACGLRVRLPLRLRLRLTV